VYILKNLGKPSTVFIRRIQLGLDDDEIEDTKSCGLVKYPYFKLLRANIGNNVPKMHRMQQNILNLQIPGGMGGP
jgi:hypothetical protein